MLTQDATILTRAGFTLYRAAVLHKPILARNPWDRNPGDSLNGLIIVSVCNDLAYYTDYGIQTSRIHSRNGV